MTNKPTLEDGSWEEDTQTADEANLEAQFIGPDGVEGFSPIDDTEPQPAIQVEMSESESTEDEEPLPEFDSRFRNDFEGLLYIGKLERTFTWLGHEFHIRTLSTDEILEVGLIHRDYAATLADVKAYQAAVVAACVISVDGQPLPVPISNDSQDTPMRNRFRYVVRSWFPPSIDVVYEEYLLLQARVDAVIDAMGKVPG